MSIKDKNVCPGKLSHISSRLLKNKHDPRNHTKQQEMVALIRVISCDLVDRFTAPTSDRKPLATGRAELQEVAHAAMWRGPNRKLFRCR